MAERSSPYKQFYPGQNIEFTMHSLNPDGSVASHQEEVTIQTIKGGGFFWESSYT